ncbi:MAG: ROK family protein [Phycisphaeraceae bacterium]|nr:ROK family protein [Phycisphaeraceae bacterium]
MKILVIDVGGTHVKVLASGEKEHRQFVSGKTMTPRKMVAGVKRITRDWKYDAISLGYPGPVVQGVIFSEPKNLGRGWIGFDFAKAFGKKVQIVNDAAMQALGGYKGGRMLFLGLGTGLGTAMIVDGVLAPMELAHLPYKKGTFEDYVGIRGLKKYGEQKWKRHVIDVIERLIAALEPSDVVIGGGNVKRLDVLPRRCRPGDNANAFIGGFRLWDHPSTRAKPSKHRR